MIIDSIVMKDSMRFTESPLARHFFNNCFSLFDKTEKTVT